MYSYSFSATFVCGLPATATIINAINRALQNFNAINRRNYKHLIVTIGSNGQLLYNLVSSVQISNTNLLRCTQQFSKELSKQPAMSSYIVQRRLLKKDC